jgi:hypothetical protein
VRFLLLIVICLLVPAVAQARTQSPATHVPSNSEAARPSTSKAQIPVIKVQASRRMVRSSRPRVRATPPASGDLAFALRARPRAQPKRVAPIRVPHTMERLRYQLELLELQGH